MILYTGNPKFGADDLKSTKSVGIPIPYRVGNQLNCFINGPTLALE